MIIFLLAFSMSLVGVWIGNKCFNLYSNWRDTNRIIDFLRNSEDTTKYKFRSVYSIMNAVCIPENRVRDLCTKSAKIVRNTGEKESWRLAQAGDIPDDDEDGPGTVAE